MPALRFLAFTLVLAGCGGPSTADMEGSVALDGTPLTAGSVTAVPLRGSPQTTVIRPDGKYVLRGLPPGEVIVTVAGPPPRQPDAMARKLDKPPPMPKLAHIPARYLALATSDLKFALKPGHNPIELELRK